MESQDNRRPELATLRQETRKVLDLGQVRQFVQHQPDAAGRVWIEAQNCGRRAFQEAGQHGTRRGEVLFLPGNEDPWPEATLFVQRREVLSEAEDLRLVGGGSEVLQELNATRQHEQHAAGGALGALFEHASRGGVRKPLAKGFAGKAAQGVDQGWKIGAAFGVQFSKDVRDEDPGRLEPHVLI